MSKFPKDIFDAIITDPPYGTTACSWDSVIPFEDMWRELKRIRKERCAIALFGSEPFSSYLRMSNIKEYKYDWIWEKEQGLGNLNAKKQPLRKYEIISVFYLKQSIYNPQMTKGESYIIKRNKNTAEFLGKNGTKDNYITKNNGERYPVNILEFNREINKRYHPTQKPIALMKYLIKTYTNEDNLILDFTCGSGTTLIAAEELNRRWVGIEIEEKYCEIIKNRLKKIKNRLINGKRN